MDIQLLKLNINILLLALIYSCGSPQFQSMHYFSSNKKTADEVAIEVITKQLNNVEVSNKASNIVDFIKVTSSTTPVEIEEIFTDIDFEINNGEAFTNSSKVELNLSSIDATFVHISNSKNCDPSMGSWFDYSESISWELEATEGLAFISIQLQKNANEKSECLSKSITYDQTKPEIYSFTASGLSFNKLITTNTIDLIMKGSDDITQMFITTSSVCDNNDKVWEDYSTHKTLLVTDSETKTASIKVKDYAGNISDCLSTAIDFESIGPTSSSILANLSTTKTSAAFSWAPSLEADSKTPYEIAIGSSENDLSDLKAWTNIGHKLGYVVKDLSLTTGVTYFASIRAIDHLGNPGPATTEKFIANSRGSLAANRMFTCMILSENNLRCWGGNDAGQLGRGDTIEIGLQIGETISSFADIDLGDDRKVLQVSAGEFHVCALLDNDSVKCWGDNTYGQLGLGDKFTRGDEENEMGEFLPAVKTGPHGSVIDISTFMNNTCLQYDTGKVACFGRGANGAAGVGRSDDWGLNENEMGDGLLAVDLGAGRSVIRLSVGDRNTCALLDNNSLKCWGFSAFGILGNGDISNHIGDNPEEMGENLLAVDLGSELIIKDITANRVSRCVLFANEKVKCWGRNYRGILGSGNPETIGNEPGEMGDTLEFVDIGENNKVRDIYSNWYQNCVVTTTNKIFCWGSGDNGALGIGTNDYIGDEEDEMGEYLKPVDLDSSELVVQLSRGSDNHYCALSADGNLKCWGRNDVGQLANEYFANIGVETDYENIGDDENEMGTNLPVAISGQQ